MNAEEKNQIEEEKEQIQQEVKEAIEKAKDEKVFLTKDEIFDCNDLTTEDVFVPEWGGKWVTVTMLTAKARELFEREAKILKNIFRIINSAFHFLSQL